MFLYKSGNYFQRVLRQTAIHRPTKTCKELCHPSTSSVERETENICEAETGNTGKEAIPGNIYLQGESFREFMDSKLLSPTHA